MLGEVVLALVMLGSLGTEAPIIRKPYSDLDSCLVDAAKLNSAPEMNTPDAHKAGARFVCYRLHVPGV
jgi:hypothetical protein